VAMIGETIYHGKKGKSTAVGSTKEGNRKANQGRGGMLLEKIEGGALLFIKLKVQWERGGPVSSKRKGKKPVLLDQYLNNNTNIIRGKREGSKTGVGTFARRRPDSAQMALGKIKKL